MKSFLCMFFLFHLNWNRFSQININQAWFYFYFQKVDTKWLQNKLGAICERETYKWSVMYSTWKFLVVTLTFFYVLTYINGTAYAKQGTWSIQIRKFSFFSSKEAKQSYIEKKTKTRNSLWPRAITVLEIPFDNIQPRNSTMQSRIPLKASRSTSCLLTWR